MAFGPARLLRQYAAGRGDLDDVGAGARRLADLFGAFERAGAGVARVEDVVDILAEAGDVPVAADDRQRRAGGDDARPLDTAVRGAAAQRIGGILRRPRPAHPGAARPPRDARRPPAAAPPPLPGPHPPPPPHPAPP